MFNVSEDEREIMVNLYDILRENSGNSVKIRDLWNHCDSTSSALKTTPDGDAAISSTKIKGHTCVVYKVV